MLGLFGMIVDCVVDAVKWVWEFFKPTVKKAWETAKLTAGVQEVCEYDEWGKKPQVKPISFKDVPKYINDNPDKRIYITDWQGRVYNARTLEEIDGSGNGQPRRKRDYRRECEDYYDEDIYYHDNHSPERNRERVIEELPKKEVVTFSEDEAIDRAALEMYEANPRGFEVLVKENNWETEDLYSHMKTRVESNRNGDRILKFNIDDFMEVSMTGKRGENGNWVYDSDNTIAYESPTTAFEYIKPYYR